ncbi:MAG: hypothetical protein AAGO57_10005, partial [Pseudomonadota bacterium]
EALAVILGTPSPALDALGLKTSAQRALAKLKESFPDRTRSILEETGQRFRTEDAAHPAPDPRVEALARAIRGKTIVRLRARSPAPQEIHPAALILRQTWLLEDARPKVEPVPMSLWGDINISARTFA